MICWGKIHDWCVNNVTNKKGSRVEDDWEKYIDILER